MYSSLRGKSPLYLINFLQNLQLEWSWNVNPSYLCSSSFVQVYFRKICVMQKLHHVENSNAYNMARMLCWDCFKKLSFGTEFCFVQIAFHFNDAKFLRDASTGLNLLSVYESFWHMRVVLLICVTYKHVCLCIVCTPKSSIMLSAFGKKRK